MQNNETQFMGTKFGLFIYNVLFFIIISASSKIFTIKSFF